ncbi:carboxypeptidase SOL1 [Ziziphus jujuba]|uniref:Carboxypeptidase SOL1 n=1 Tax=Ziziphus jujuba TaxID=326968 RepID=A0ABM4A9C0_ZIZJJ|nr:carboxypeptidase SOL1 [Ziziphus jujuba]
MLMFSGLVYDLLLYVKLQLPTLWEYNRRSMLNLVLTLVQTGVHRRIFSSDTGRPLPCTIPSKGINYTLKTSQEFADYHRLLPLVGRYKAVATAPGYRSKTTSIWLEEAATTVDFILDPEVTPEGNLLRSACES